MERISRSKVIVSRKWPHNAPIEAFVTHEAVGAHMKLDDFIQALMEEIGTVGVFTTKASLQTKLTKAADTILTEMKSHTAKVV